MPFRLSPRDRAFYEMFEEAGRNVRDAAELLGGLCRPGCDRAAVANALRQKEHANDGVTHRILRQLNTSFVTPFDREDIYRLAARLDDVVDAMDAVADFIVVADVGPLPRLVEEQLRLLERSAAITADAMSKLRTLGDLEPCWIEVNRLENEADRVYRKLQARLFSGEIELLQVLKLREVVDQLEEAADALEHVAHAVETIAVKEA
ncbi:MAG: DUF47 family protein [Actinobacteria bacterium]|nr:DUF47 family protein [Actinomycetota bacterium]